MYYSAKTNLCQLNGSLLSRLLFASRNAIRSLFEFFVYVVLDQLSLDHSNQVAVVVVDYETNRALTPRKVFVKVCKPQSMVTIVSIENYPRPAEKLKSAHISLVVKKGKCGGVAPPPSTCNYSPCAAATTSSADASAVSAGMANRLFA